MKDLFWNTWVGGVLYLVIIFNMQQGNSLGAYILIGLTILVVFLVKHQRDQAQNEVRSLKDNLFWHRRLLELTHRANPTALQAGIGLEAEKLLRQFDAENIQRRYADPDSKVMDQSLEMLHTQIKEQKKGISRLVATAVDIGLVMPTGWRYQDLATERNTK